MATATPKPIDTLSRAGRAAAFGEIRGILEREHAGKPGRGDAERLAELADALNLTGAKLLELRAVVRYFNTEAALRETASATIAASRTEALEKQWDKGRDEYERAYARRQSLKDQIIAGREADKAAHAELGRTTDRIRSLEKAYPAMFGIESNPVTPARDVTVAIEGAMRELSRK